ncbi:MAG: SurA N-terminal domain-containing protein [Deltaproteobacteria bacterium]|nr:SurA N-terminal domain-containing protein [Deltaproteobacteria bacterium]
MLDQMRKHSRSFIIYIFFGIIIAVFVVNFGPQSAGCTTSTTYAARVAGNTLSTSDFTYAMAVAGLKEQQVQDETQLVQLRGIVMDQLIVRELLAEEALKVGLRIPAKEIEDMLLKGRYMALGQPRPLMMGEDGKFDYDRFSRYARWYWGVSVKKFKEHQTRELLADKMRGYLRGSVKVSEEEVKADFMHKNTQVKLAYVRFSPTDLKSQVALDEAAVKAFAAANKDKIRKHYEANKSAYVKLPKQVQLLVLKTSASGGGKEKARRKAEAALKRLQGGASFTEVAKTESEDPDTKGAGGYLGWRNVDATGLGPAVDKAVAGLKEGSLSSVIEEKDAFVVVKVAGTRQGDLTPAQAEDEIARQMATDDAALQLAKTSAAAFIKRARAGEKLGDLFTPEEGSEGAKPEAEAKEGKDAPASQAAKPDRSPLKLAKTSLFNRSAQHLVPGVGISEPLSSAAFKLKKGETASEPYVIGRVVYLVSCDDRTEPDMGEWTKKKDELTEQVQIQKFVRMLRTHVHEVCTAALKANEIKVTPSILSAPVAEEPGAKRRATAAPAPAYTPCQSLAPTEAS